MPWTDALAVHVIGSGPGCWDYRLEAPWRKGNAALQVTNKRLCTAWNQGQQVARRKSVKETEDVWCVCESWPGGTRTAVYRAGKCIQDSHGKLRHDAPV